MKKKAILALTLAGLVALQIPMTSFAATTVHLHNGSQTGAGENSDIEATDTNPAVVALDSDVNCVVKNVTSEDATAIDASSGATVTAENVTSESAKAIDAKTGASVTADSTTNNAYSPTVNADGSGTKVTVKGAVENEKDGNGYAIKASNSAEVTAGSATNNSANVTVEASSNSTVKIEAEDGTAGTVTNTGTGKAIEAFSGATVTAGSATNGKADETSQETIFASNSDTTVVITDSVTNNGNGYAVKVESGATVVVEGTIDSYHEGSPTACVDNAAGTRLITYQITNSKEEYRLINGDGAISNVYYIIRGTDSEGISVSGTNDQTVLSKTYRTAQLGDEIKVSVESNYELKAGTLEVTLNADGTYSIMIPVGGGVTLETIQKAVEQAQAEAEEEQRASFTGTEDNAVSDGQWSTAPDGSWFYYANGAFKDTWAYIANPYANAGQPSVGWFWFDGYGVMATGWKTIGGKMYYFNEAHDGTYGMLLVNTTTPDGYRVGADGARIQ